MPTFFDRLRNFYEQKPDQITLYIQHAGKPDLPVTYRMLVEGAAAYAHALELGGIRQGEVVLLILQHGIDLVYAFFGAVLHGAIPSIMPFLTEKLLPERYRADLASLVSITQPSAIITYPEFESEVRAALHQGDSVRVVLVSDQVGKPLVPNFAASGGNQRTPQDIVLLQHSSGTTGLQKGVALSHQAVINQLEAYSQALHFADEDIVVSWLPLYHDMGLIAGFLMPILWGMPLVLMSPFDWVRAPYRLLQSVSKYKGTLTWLPNFAYNFCAQKIRERDLEGVDLTSWRAVSNCSEPVRWESHQLFLKRFQLYGLRESALATCYAMAENVFAVTQGGIDAPPVVDEIDRDLFQTQRIARPAQPGQAVVKMMSSGRPVSNTRVRVLDENGKEVPDRLLGEIALQSDCMLNEYYHRPDATQKAFRDGWYLTGDYGYRVGDELFVYGRKKDLIIVGGRNVYPQDLEQVAMEVDSVHAGRVVAFGVYNEEAGTEDVVIVAETENQDEDERNRLSDGIRQAVTRGSAVALRQVYLVDPHWLIKTSSGKTARAANRDKYLAEMSVKGGSS